MDLPPALPRRSALVDRIPPHAYFVVSAIFHYLGPSFAVLLFARIEPLGVAWLRIASAAVVFAAWRRPWRYFSALNRGERWTVAGLGVVLAGMNCLFYLAIQQLPLGTAGAIEFLGPIGLAALGTRSLRNVLALLVAISGVYILTDVRLEGAPMGYVFAFANCALFIVYIILGHRISGSGGIDRLGISMLIAMAAAFPVASVRRCRHSMTSGCSQLRSASVSRRLSFLTSPISSRWRGCRARPLQCSCRSFPPPRPRSASLS